MMSPAPTPGPKPIRSIAGRWRISATAADTLPIEMQGVAVCFFYSGFQAALDAFAEIQKLPPNEAAEALAALNREADGFNLTAQALSATGRPN